MHQLGSNGDRQVIDIGDDTQPARLRETLDVRLEHQRQSGFAGILNSVAGP
jgi:hypothetical protein